MQNGADPECVVFQKMANQGHYGGRDGTRQGIYVCAPNGKFLASVNSNNPDRVLEMMREGLAAWEKLPAGQQTLSANVETRHRWEDSFPVDGLNVNVISRDLPEQCDPTSPCEVKWNQDYIWFSKDEARRWLGENPQVGNEHPVPEALVARLARFHFVDNVKGQTSGFSRRGVKGSKISTRVTARDGSLVRLKISGLTQGVAAEGWWQTANGVVTRVLGNAAYDLDKEKFVEFEMVALGRRWGRTRFNGRRRDPNIGPLGYVFRLEPPNAPRIAPAYIYDYDVDWVVGPRR